MIISSVVVAGLRAAAAAAPHGPRYLMPQGPDDVVLATATFGADASMHRRLLLALHVESTTILDTGAESQSPGSEIFATGDWDAYVQRTQAEHII
ncbi:hypothetical protein SPRG_16619 [Saprolegnia parasitica CBS 223.65]|uniref:MBL fold metallo-hydrolase n=1 Tax=Saprolegnia parasitica (strain CBS 223.65) TaxID=695850 RepID=A0A067BMK6_SAPPC|nr:hypothetical protein SPRG_16619 [Saprolegnia parasitica CBS 223.65]KDO17985.1 hypothetical protein SPRG_16619 [Saprolegnia parasitica CBS 223.65]|eukprot:XP_012211314.1 hypothetical protein SPRG_16619 [Saprolegnia parasitica CBS 223.65]